MATGQGSNLALEKMLKMQESMHGPTSIQAAAAAHKLAKSLIEQGSFISAEPLLRRALHIYSHVPTIDQAKQAEVQNDLDKTMVGLSSNETDSLEKLTVSSDHIPSFLPSDQALRQPKAEEQAKKLTPAEALAGEIVELRKGGKSNLALAEALVKLAGIYNKQSMLEKMEPLLKEALEIREAVSGKEHISVSADLKNLGRLLYFMGKYEVAEPYLQRALVIRQKELGELHPYVADVAEWYSRLLRKTNRPDEAMEMEALVRNSRSKFGSEWDHYRAAAVKATEQENYFSAQALWLAALDESKEFTSDDPRLSLTLESLAEVYWKQLKYDKAEPLCKRLLQIWENVLGPDHADVAVAANNLAMLCERQGKHVEAALLYEQVIGINEKVLGPNHPDLEVIRRSWTKARRMAQKQVELKVAKAEGR
jgi:tetratricopeptide (TPR) repeat protein